MIKQKQLEDEKRKLDDIANKEVDKKAKEKADDLKRSQDAAKQAKKDERERRDKEHEADMKALEELVNRQTKTAAVKESPQVTAAKERKEAVKAEA